MRTLVPMISSVLAILVAGLSLSIPDVFAVDARPVRITQVEQQPVRRTVSTFGVLAPRVEDLSFRTDGRIATFNVLEGQTVKAGEELAVLEKRDAEDALNQARIRYEQASRQLERFQKLAEENMIQESQLEQALSEMESVTIALQQAELELDRCTLRAPADGVILKEYLDSRTSIVAGRPIYSFRDASRPWITKVELTDQNAFAFGLGASARARFAPYPGEEFAGSLTKQAGIADKNNGLYTVEITIDTQDRELRPGMVVEIDLLHETDEVFTTVPLDALVDVRGNRGVIYLLDEGDSRAREVPIHIVAITGGSVAVAEPIPAGTSVVVRGQQSLRDMTPVIVI